MTTQVTLFQNNAAVPAHIAARLGNLSPMMQAALANLSGESVPRLKLEQGRWRIREGGDEIMLDTLHADVIVVGLMPVESKTFYAKAYVPGQEPAAPDCASIRGDKPDAGSTSPQSATCATCPQNVWGSKITPQGTETKACSDTRRLAVVSADDPSGTVYLLSVPAASLKNFKAYMKQLAVRGYSIDLVVTRLTAGTANYPLYEFNAMNFIDEEQSASVAELASLQIDGVLGVAGLPTQAMLPAPAPQVAPAPPPAPAPQVEAPAAKKGFGGKKTTAAAPAPTPASAPAPQAPPQVASSNMSELEAQIAALSSL